MNNEIRDAKLNDTPLVQKYLEVIVQVDTHGKKTPLAVVFESEEYKIDRVLRVEPVKNPFGFTPDVKYVVWIRGIQRELFRAPDGRWYVKHRGYY